MKKSICESSKTTRAQRSQPGLRLAQHRFQTWAAPLIMFIIYIINCKGAFGLPEVLRIGGLFENGDDAVELAFRYAVDRINADNKILAQTRLSPQVERLERSDSFQASKRVCSLLHEGVAAIFGPQSTESSSHVQSTCGVMHVPHMETRWDLNFEATANHSINLYPDPIALSKAYKDLVKLKNWKSFAILYQENEALVRVQEVLKDPELREKRIIVRQFPYNLEYRRTFKELSKWQIKNIVIDVPRDHIYNVLKHAQQVESLTEYHNYFFTTLDLHTVDLEDFQYAGTNISSFSLIDQNSREFSDALRDWQSGPNRWRGTSSPSASALSGPAPGLVTSSMDQDHTRQTMAQNFTTEVALMYDSVRLLAQALSDLDRSQAISVHSLSCEGEEPWQYGNTLTNYMKMITIQGITSEVKFDESGKRSDFRLILNELTRDGLKTVGDWRPKHGISFMSNYSKAMEEGFRKTLSNKTLVVVTVLNDPYVMLVKDHKDRLGNDKFEGYCVELIDEIASILGFKYTLKLADDRAYGKKNERGEWNGMIRELIDGKADLAIADLTMTYERESVVDFSMPFMSLGIGILFKKPKKDPPKLFSFMSPLAVEVWVYLITAFLGVTLFLFIVARFSPYQWINPHPCDKNPNELENEFSMKNTLWFTIGCLMQQGCDVMPRALSTRVLAASWWFFILILVSSYTANLAAFLTVERMDNTINSAEDLAKQTKVHYGCVQSGSTQAFFKNSNFTTYARMWSFMESTRPSVFVENNAKGVERVKKGDYAFLMESTTIEYIVERQCELYQVGGLLDSKGYGVATPADSPYRGLISDAILQLQERGRLHELKNKWWSQRGTCGPKETSKGSAAMASELGLAHVGGVFVVLAGGSIIAVVICLGEFVWKMKKIPRTERDNIFMELFKEFKAVVLCYGSTRPVRKTSLTEDLTDSQLSALQANNGLGSFMPVGGFPDGPMAGSLGKDYIS